VERDRYEKKIDYDKILFPYEKYFKKFSSRRSILKTMFIRANPGCFDCLYKDIPRGLANYWRRIEKLRKSMVKG